MKKISLPTINGEGEYIDAENFQWAYIFKKDSVKFVHCFIGKKLHFLHYSLPLENWFKESGVYLIEFGNVADGGKLVLVNNIPEKYKIPHM
ncbi:MULTISPECIES: hypothetical protein [Duganella]|uniref:Uncharacterized protein n=2 Tax=Duganella TaxID=75654 RepID=A0A845GTZ5_9BURK|nr:MULTISPECIES: hypothetical protein [Duganella]MYM80759.1 hypothetical protein [Duganella lactea]MYM96137.1 hypothetical protein [Duganella vulcania]